MQKLWGRMGRAFFFLKFVFKVCFLFVVAFLEEFSLSVGPFATLPLCLPCSALLLHMHILFDLNTFQPVLLAYLSCTVALVNAIYSSISNLMRFTAILWPKQTTQSREQEHRRGRQNLGRHETETLIFDLFDQKICLRKHDKFKKHLVSSLAWRLRRCLRNL